MGSWPGRRAGNAVRTTWRAGTAGSVMGETAKIRGSGKIGRSKGETRSRRHTHWENGVGDRKVRVARDELRQMGGRNQRA